MIIGIVLAAIFFIALGITLWILDPRPYRRID